MNKGQRCPPIVLQMHPSLCISPVPFLSATVAPGTHQPHAHSLAAEAAWKWVSGGRGRWKSQQQLWGEQTDAGTWWPCRGVSSQQLLLASFSGVLRSPVLGVLSSASSLQRLHCSPDISRSKHFPASSSIFFLSFFLFSSFCCNTYSPHRGVTASLFSFRYLLQTPSRLSASQVNTCLAVLTLH